MRIGFALLTYLPRFRSRVRVACLSLCSSCWLGCATTTVPDPALAVQRYLSASRCGDADQLYDLMTTRAQRESSRAETRNTVRAQSEELRQRALSLARNESSLTAHANLRFQDGDEASLTLHDGRYWVNNAANLPGGAQSPAQALREFRAVVVRRSYTGLLRMLTAATRKAVENDLRSLVAGLLHPETLDLRPQGDSAVVNVPGGHLVKLRRENGAWFVEDFE
jgi:hypothetical protein